MNGQVKRVVRSEVKVELSMTYDEFKVLLMLAHYGNISGRVDAGELHKSLRAVELEAKKRCLDQYVGDEFDL